VGPLTAASLRQPSHQQFTVSHPADVGAVRRAVRGYADQLQTGPGLADRAGQAATELAANLLQHALPGGWILARPLPPAAVEILAVDHGPGIDDVAAAVGGRSPRPGGLGCGLAAVARVSSYFDIHTGPGRPTTVLAVVESADAARAAGFRPPRPPRPPRCWAGVSVGLDEACGDAWAVAEVNGGTTVAMIDGLGHGVHASLAADAAVATLADDPTDLDGYIYRANTAMLGTRGAAVMVCRLEPDRGELRCLSVGNIRAGILSGSTRRTLISHRGAVGTHEKPPRAKVMSYPWPPGAVLVLWTDGLAGHIDLAAYAELFTRDPAITAAVLHRDCSSGRDDSTVAVVRNQGRP
jgi:anti-sigma regulatory factor (Ser/Thr protein kinase)